MQDKPANGDRVPPSAEELLPVWRDSSLELEQGLDVTELHVDVELPLEPSAPQWLEPGALQER